MAKGDQDPPHPVHEVLPTTSSPPLPANSNNDGPRDCDASCPFCSIALTYRPVPPPNTSDPSWDPDRLSPPTYVLLATEHVIAFLDIAPLTRGHVLIAPRKHRTKIGDLSSDEAAELGRVLPLVTRAVMSSVLPDIPHDEVDYNVVQNNGPGAAQVIPHVHFHVIPRPPLNYKAPQLKASLGSKARYAPAQIPTGLRASYIQFGRGQRHELDDDDAVELVKFIRENAKLEWQKDFGGRSDVPRLKDAKL